MLTGRPRGQGQNARFEVIRESNKTFSEHIVLIGNCLTMGSMTKLRHQQPSLWHPGLTKDIEDLWEPWMRLVDHLLEDEQLLDTVYEAQGERYPQSRRRGREQTPAEVVLRLLLLKHIRNWSYDTLEREVRANLVYRAFTRIGDEKVPDAKTLARLGQLLGPEVIEELHKRIVQLAQENGVTHGQKLRVDTTVVETNIHYPTDSSLLGDGTRVLTRTMKKIEQKAGGLKRKVRDRMRSVRKRVLAIALSTRYLGAEGEARRKKQYGELLSLTRKTVNQAQRILDEVKAGPRARRIPLRSLVEALATMKGRVQQVVKQTKLRIFAGVSKSQDKIVSVFESHTEIIRKGKASKPTEFGKLVKIQESENQIISHFEVFAERPSDRQLLVPSIEVHQRRFGRIPAWVAADAGFHSQQNEKTACSLGVRWFSVPNQKTKSAERRRLYRQRWFRRGQRWRTGCEGRISALKRRHGMRRCLYRGFHGMQRWVGLSVMADNVMQIGRCLALQGT
jgi:transposase, IS5 family